MITFEVTYNEEIKSLIESNLNVLIQDIKSAEALSSKISEIIVTEDLRTSIKNHCQKHNVPELNISKGREYNVVSKIVDFNDSVKVFFDCNYLFSKLGYQTFNETIISIFTDDIIYKLCPTENEFQLTDSLDEILEKCLLGIWISKLYGQKIIKKAFHEREIIFKTAKSFTNSFKRNVRKALFNYQKTNNVDELWITLIRELDYFVRKSIEVKTDNIKLLDLDEFEIPLLKIISELEIIEANILNNEKPEKFELKKAIRAVFRICKLEIPIFGPINVRIKESPKSVFKDLVDTETRIVAFIDILGFSALIEEYDNDETSNILNNLHEALELGIKTSIESMANPKIKSELAENLDYRMFSDCISLSLPFIEHGDDFNTQLNSICTIVKIYQLLMIQKGFYIRGGVAIGSYFSSDKMIFSGGLVKAYKIETKANYPIVVLSDEIIERLKKNNSSVIPGVKLEDSFVYHIDDPNKIFINPFESIDNTHKNLEYVLKIFDELKGEANTSESNDPIDKLSNSFFNLISTFTKPIIEQAKNQMTDEVMNKTKENALDELMVNIRKCEERIEKARNEKSGVEIHEKVMLKLKYFEQFILWSIMPDKESMFRKVEFE